MDDNDHDAAFVMPLCLLLMYAHDGTVVIVTFRVFFSGYLRSQRADKILYVRPWTLVARTVVFVPGPQPLSKW